jgi:hypothetical protein
VISKLTPGTGRANLQVVGALLRARSREPFGCYGTDLVQRLSTEGIEAHDGSLFLCPVRLMLNLVRQVHAGGQTGGLRDWDNFPL